MLKVILILLFLLSGLIVAASLHTCKDERSVFAFENSARSIEVESPYFETAHVYKGQLHCHTKNSDGAQRPLVVAEAYRNAGYDFIAITDHDYVTPNPNSEGVLFIMANEVSSSLGHISTINVPSVAPSLNTQEVIDWTKAQGGLTWLAHPACSNHWTAEELASISGYHGIEVYNYAYNSYAEEKWDYILTDLDSKITAIAVDDCHNVKDSDKFDGGWVMVFADSLKKADIRNNLEKGNFYSTQGPIINSVSVEGTTISIKMNQTSKITWIGAGGSILQEITDVTEDSYVVHGTEKYVRIRVDCEGYAWTNPIYISSLIIHSASVSDPRVNPSQLITFSSQAYYRAPITPPASGNSALQFIPDSFVQVSRNECLEPIEMSFSLWVKFDEYDPSDHQTLISKRETDSGYFVIWNATAQMIRFYVFTDEWRFVTASPPPVEEWCHVAGTYKSSTGELSLYVNGSLTDEAIIEKGGILHSLTELTIGAANPSYIPEIYGINGTIDEVVLDDLAWNQTEVGLAYQGVYPNGTVLYLPFDGNTQDYSGNGNHGTNYNATWTAGRKVNVQAYIYLDGKKKGALSVIEADGSFTFPTFPAESSVGLYNYLIYAVWGGHVSAQNQTLQVIVDGLKVATFKTNLSNDQVQVRLLYAYDDVVVENGNVTFAELFATTNSEGWATFNLSSLNTVEWGVTSYAIAEPKYGLTAKLQNQTISYAKATISTFIIKANNPINDVKWNFFSRELSFNSSGTIIIKIGDLEKPMQIKTDGVTNPDWTYDPTSRQVTLRNTHSRTVLKWASFDTELWIIAAFSVGLAVITAVIFIKKRGNIFYSKTKSQGLLKSKLNA